MKCDIISFDTQGSGISEGEFSYTNFGEDFCEVVNFIKNELRIDFSNVIIYAYQKAIPSIIEIISKGLIRNFHSIILQSSNFFLPNLEKDNRESINNRNSFSFDFPSFISKLGKMDYYILAIHGTIKDPNNLDEEIYSKINKLTTWYPKGTKGQSIIEELRKDYYEKISDFFKNSQETKIIFNRSKKSTSYNLFHVKSFRINLIPALNESEQEYNYLRKTLIEFKKSNPFEVLTDLGFRESKSMMNKNSATKPILNELDMLESIYKSYLN